MKCIALNSLLTILEPPRRIFAWSCCTSTSKLITGCKLAPNGSMPRFHPGSFSCFCHDCKSQINGFETSRCAAPCQGNWAQKAPNTYSMVHKNWEKNDDEIEFVYLHTFSTMIFRSPWAKKSEGKRNWFEWTCCGSGSRAEDGCQPVEIVVRPPSEFSESAPAPESQSTATAPACSTNSNGVDVTVS